MLINGKLVKLPWKAIEENKKDLVDMTIKRSGTGYPYSKLKVGVLGGTDLLPSVRKDCRSRGFAIRA